MINFYDAKSESIAYLKKSDYQEYRYDDSIFKEYEKKRFLKRILKCCIVILFRKAEKLINERLSFLLNKEIENSQGIEDFLGNNNPYSDYYSVCDASIGLRELLT